MASAPMKYSERTALGQHLKDEDHDLLVDLYRGWTTAGVFKAQFDYIITQTEIGGVDYYYGGSAYQNVFGGPDDDGAVDGTDFDAVLDACLGAGTAIFIKKAAKVYPVADNHDAVDDLFLDSDGAILDVAGALPSSANGIFSDNAAAATRVAIRGLTMQMNDQNINILRFYKGSSYINIYDCTFKDCIAAGVNSEGTSGASHVRVVNCRFIDVKSCILAYGSGSTQWFIYGNDFTGSPFAYAASAQHGAHDIIFSNNHIHQVNRSGEVMWGFLTEDSYPTKDKAYNIVMSDNVVEDFGWTDKDATDGIAFMLSDSYNCVVKNNVIYQSYLGALDMGSATYSTFEGNIVDTTWGDGLTASLGTPPSYNTIRGNTFVNCGKIEAGATTRGINLHGTYCHVSDNLIVGDGSYPHYGIQERTESASDYNTLKDNRVVGVGTADVWVVGSHTVVDMQLVAPQSLDLSGAATDLMVFHADRDCVLVGYTMLYTEASSADAGASLRIGRYQDGVALDNDYYDTGVTSEVSKSLGYAKVNDCTEMVQTKIAAGDSVTVGTGGGKTGTGEILFILKIAVT